MSHQICISISHKMKLPLITSDGIDAKTMENVDLSAMQDIIQCHCCTKYYNKSLVVMDNDVGGQTCKHCLCMLNYDVQTRLDFDMKCVLLYKFSIASYILECHGQHDTKTCTRKQVGGCFLCDYILCNEITNILNREGLPKYSATLSVAPSPSKKKIKKIMIVDNDMILHEGEELDDKLVI